MLSSREELNKFAATRDELGTLWSIFKSRINVELSSTFQNTKQYLLFEYQRHLLYIFNFKIMKALSHHFLSRPSHCRFVCPHRPPLPAAQSMPKSSSTCPSPRIPTSCSSNSSWRSSNASLRATASSRTRCVLSACWHSCADSAPEPDTCAFVMWSPVGQNSHFSRFVSTIVPFDLARGGVVGPQVRSWAATRWADLHIDTLNRGVEAFLKQLKALPDDLKKMPTCRLVEEKLAAFQESGAHCGRVSERWWRVKHHGRGIYCNPIIRFRPAHANSKNFTVVWNIVPLNHPHCFLLFPVM
jgi:hypothetical protein